MGKYILSWNDGNGSIRWAQYDPTDQGWKFGVNGIGTTDNLSAPQIASLYQRRILIVWNKINQQIHYATTQGDGSTNYLGNLDWAVRIPRSPVVGAFTSSTPALCTSGNRAAVAFRGKNNQVYYNIFHHNQNNDWDGAKSVVGGFTNSAPSLAFS
jgi:hypothetical protein